MTELADNQGHGSGLKRDRITRRELLIDTVVGFTFATPILAAVFAAVRYIIPPARIITGAAERVQVAAVADVGAGQSKDFVYRDAPYALIHIDNEFRALSKVCTHLGCIVDWQANERIFRCPCHNAVFDAGGSVVSGPAPRPLPHLKVEIADGKVYVSA
jgi:cytochrome b6-f complex iron-sulfur subunit